MKTNHKYCYQSCNINLQLRTSMPPKKENKKQALSKPDNSGIPKQDVEFKFVLTVKSDASEPPPYSIMFEWFGSLSDRLERIETGLLDSWKKDQNNYTLQRQLGPLRIDDDFCKTITSKQFYVYFVNVEDCRVEDNLSLDYSSLLTATQNPQFIYQSRTIKALGIDQFSLKVTADKPLLTEVYRHYLNPFEVQVVGAKDVPNDQSSRYQPVYVKYELLDAGVVVTQPVVGSNRLVWSHKHVFLFGLMDAATLKQKMRSRYVKFELHDRDQISNRKLKADLEVYDVTKAIQEQIEKQKPIQEDPKKKGAPKKEQKKEAKKQTKKQVKKKDAKIGEPILPPPIEIISNNFGISVFSLVEFLKPSVRTSSYKAAVVPRNAFEDLQSFNIDLNTTARNEMQKVFASNNYFDCDTELVVGFTLAYPIGAFVKPEQKEEVVQDPKKKKEPVKQIPKQLPKEEKHIEDLGPVFERIVYVIPYNEQELISKIQQVFYDSNLKAFNLKNRRELTTYLLKKEEQDSQQLDFVTGLQIVDPEGRIFILEGLKHKAMQLFHQNIKKNTPNTRSHKYLQNTNLSFRKRLFSDFHLQLKRIRLRPSLSQLLLEPSLYIKAKVPQQIYINLNKLSDIRKVCDDLSTVDSLNLWPSAQCLIKIQRKFSQSLSQMDLTGGQAPQIKDSQDSKLDTKNINLFKQTDFHVVTTDQFFLPKINNVEPHAQTTPTNQFQGTKRTVMTKTFTKDQGKLVKTYQMRGRSANIPQEEPVYIYGGQRNNFYEKQLAQLREEMKRNPNVLYTYSRDHFNLAIEPRSLKEESKHEQQLSLSKMYSKDKFSSLLVRTKEERMSLPKKPTSQDIQNLKDYPYHEQKARELQARKNGRDAPVPNGKQDFRKYLRPKEIFSDYPAIQGQKLSPVQKQRQERQLAKRAAEEQKLKMKGQPVIHLKKSYYGDKSYGVDRFKDIREGQAKKLGLLDHDKGSHQRRSVQPYQVSYNLKQQTIDPSFNPLIRRDNSTLNIDQQEFNFYQPMQILTRTQIYKPLKNVL